jgi:hypothetical protein
MNEDDHRGFGFYLWVDHECLDSAVTVLERHVLVVAGRCFETRFGPVLRVDGSDREKHKRSRDGECRGAKHGGLHGEEFSHSAAGTASDPCRGFDVAVGACFDENW